MTGFISIQYLFRILELGVLFVAMVVIVIFPAMEAELQAKADAKKFLLNADTSQCNKKLSNKCIGFVNITVKPGKKLSGFIALSGPKEWAIYQPPYITGQKIGKMVVVKRDAIVEVSHAIDLRAMNATDDKQPVEQPAQSK